MPQSGGSATPAAREDAISAAPSPPGPVAAARHLACALICALAGGLVLSGCGPTAEQLREQAATTAPAPPPTTAPPAPADPAPRPTPEAAPLKVGVSGNQIGMAQQVQDACQWLLRRDPGPIPAAEAAGCVSAAAVAGGGATQEIDSQTSLLPTGRYSAEFTASEPFTLRVDAADGNLAVRVGEGRRDLLIDGQAVPADSGGTAEEAYAEVLVGAAEATTRPSRLATLLNAAESIGVQYDAEIQGTPAVRLTAVLPAGSAAGPAREAELWLDAFYRPVRIELNGAEQGIPFRLVAVNSGWLLP